MFNFFRRFLKRKPEKDTFSLIEENWYTNFTGNRKNRFEQEDTATYAAVVENKTLNLQLKKKDLFAWIDNPLYRYSDFFIEADLSFKQTNGHCSVGFLLRRSNESNYYYFLISNKGYFRFDVVFNGHPRPLIDWTPCDLPEEKLFIRLLARGNNFSFFLEADWIGEVEDSTLIAGGISFAAQNYDEKDQAGFSLHQFRINSIPIEIEAQYYRWNKYIPIEPESRIQLARTFFSINQFTAAVVQLGKAFRDHSPDADEYFLLGECQANLGAYEEALENICNVLSIRPDDRQALTEKANLLYKLNRFLELRDFLKSHISGFADSSVLWNLYGNAWYSLGNWQQAALAYHKAGDIEPDMPIFLLNAARAYDRLKNTEKALEHFLQAARLFFRQEAYEDLARILPRVEALDKKNNEVLSIKGKVLFQEHNFSEAKKIFKSLLDEGYEDSSVEFMYGLLLVSERDRQAADFYLQKAADSEPEFYLYWFRLAENRLILFGDPGDALQHALERAPENRWVLNLAGQYYLESGAPEKAATYLEKACVNSENECEIYINYSEALFQSGDVEASLAVLKNIDNNSNALNQMANIETRRGNLQEAITLYERAMAIDSFNPAIKENCASAYIEIDMVNRAEEILAGLIDRNPSGRAYNLIGNIARIKGEPQRAESAYTEGIRAEPENHDLLLNLADLYIEKGDFGSAVDTLEKVPDGSEPERSARLRQRLRKSTHMQYICSGCGLEWWVPLDIGPQPQLKIQGEPPRESPAGKCPECGAVYCIRCAEKHLKEERFFCQKCNENLKLSDDHLKYLVSSYLRRE